MLYEENFTSKRSWEKKFGDAFRGVHLGVRNQSSFFVHFFFTAMVVMAAIILGVSLIEWCLLLLCITLVLTAEMFNSALESFAKAVTEEFCPHVGSALEIGSGAVLLASTGAALVGTIIVLNRLGTMLGWW